MAADWQGVLQSVLKIIEAVIKTVRFNNVKKFKLTNCKCNLT